MRKRLAVLQITPEEPTPEHVRLFAEKADCDFFFVTHDRPHPQALKYCPNTTWIETRNILAELVPKNYDYYAFVDYDYELISRTEKGVLEQLLTDLDRFHPPVMIPYPGEKGLATPLAGDISYRDSREYSVHPFTHCGMKIVHHSLLDYFFPFDPKFNGSFAASHLFNILELPFLRQLVVTHNVRYNNTKVEDGARYSNGKFHMDRMWCWLRPYFHYRHWLRPEFPDGVPEMVEEYTTYTDSMEIKKFFVEYCKLKNFEPVASSPQENWLDWNRIGKFFDLNHEHFAKHFPGARRRSDTLVVVGNGPSLKPEYFDLMKEMKVDTFGMNSIYRYFEQMNWYPTYFMCSDYALSESHKNEFSRMVLDPNNPIEKFYLLERPSVEARIGHTNPYFSEEVRQHPKVVERTHNQDGLLHPQYGTGKNKLSCTGVQALRAGIELGYKKILMIGHDAVYKQPEYFKEKVQKQSEWVRKFAATPDENPNYFWKDYQRAGDIYNCPGNPLPVWDRFAQWVRDYTSVERCEVEIVNASPISAIQGFPKGDFRGTLESWLHPEPAPVLPSSTPVGITPPV